MDSYFLRKDVIFLLLKVGGVPGPPGRGSGCMTTAIWEEGGTDGVDAGSEGVPWPEVLLLEILADIYG